MNCKLAAQDVTSALKVTNAWPARTTGRPADRFQRQIPDRDAERRRYLRCADGTEHPTKAGLIKPSEQGEDEQLLMLVMPLMLNN